MRSNVKSTFVGGGGNKEKMLQVVRKDYYKARTKQETMSIKLRIKSSAHRFREIPIRNGLQSKVKADALVA